MALHDETKHQSQAIKSHCTQHTRPAHRANNNKQALNFLRSRGIIVIAECMDDVFVYVCMYMYMYAMLTCKSTYAYGITHIYIYICIFVNINLYVYRTCIHIRICTYVCMYVCMYVLYMYTWDPDLTHTPS